MMHPNVICKSHVVANKDIRNHPARARCAVPKLRGWLVDVFARSYHVGLGSKVPEMSASDFDV